MRFHFLGTGTSAGIPIIACDCPVCTSADRRDKRLRAAAAVSFTDAGGQERVVLLDAGPDLRAQALAASFRRCDAVLFTHNHVDHTFGLDEVRRFNAVMKQPIDIYAEPNTLDHLRRVYKHIFEAHRNVNDSFVATLIPHTIDANPDGQERAAITLHGLRFTPIRLLHGRLPVLGFRIEPEVERLSGPSVAGPGGVDRGSESRATTDPWWPLAYCTDVSGIPPESWRLFKGVNTLVLDALRKRRHPTHFTLDQAISAAERIGARQTYFIHMAHELGHAATEAELPEGMHLAYDGLVLE
jgi:phosphoribosyl 1,2-cyclic phosphate phosphodiesterase